ARARARALGPRGPRPRAGAGGGIEGAGAGVRSVRPRGGGARDRRAGGTLVNVDRRLGLALALVVAPLVAACGESRTAYEPGAMAVDSPAIPRGGRIPKKYTGDGDDVSPPLSWAAPPSDAKELALVVEDA